ncbi:MAG: hypothetical protein K0U98_13935 [Deltaproteobacteria bacterium]|nr:hypothetical protein [Deltaproteobacteria bacterium]
MRRAEASFRSTWAVALLAQVSLVVALFGVATFPAYGDLQAYSDPEALGKGGGGFDVAVNGKGEMVVVRSTGNSLHAQSYDSAGRAQGNIAVIPPVSLSVPLLPAVAMDQQGRFVLAWRYESLFPDPSPPIGHVFLQLFDAEANPVGSTFQAFPFDQHVSGFPRLAMAPDGSFWVAGRTGDSGDAGVIVLRRFDSQGSPMTESLRVSAPTENPFHFPLLAMAPDGRLATLTSDCEITSCTHPGVRAQVYGASGAPLGEGVELTDQGLGYGVAWVPGQGFVALWRRPSQPDLPLIHQIFAIEGRAFGEDSVGPIFVVKGESEGVGTLSQYVESGVEVQSKVAVDSFGNLVVTWEEELDFPADSGIYARALDSQLDVNGPIVEVSFGAGQPVFGPVVAPIGPRRFNLIWVSVPDGQGSHLVGQKFLVSGDDCLPASTSFCLQQGLPSATPVTMEGSGL